MYEKGLDLQQRQGKVEEAIAVFYQAIQADYPPAINHFAWLRATSPLAKYRNGAEAVKLSERACRLSARPEEPSKFGSDCLDTLASAYAEAGMWDKAVEAAKRAIAMAEEVNNRAGVREFTTRLEMFQKKQPYRDEQ